MLAIADHLVAIGGSNISNMRCDVNFFISVSKSHPVVAGECHVEVKTSQKCVLRRGVFHGQRRLGSNVSEARSGRRSGEEKF